MLRQRLLSSLLFAALAFLGGLEETRPKKWEETLSFMSSCIGFQSVPNSAWRKLTAPPV